MLHWGKPLFLQMLILLRVSICSPLLAKAFAAECLEDPSKQEEDLEGTYQYIVVSQQDWFNDTYKLDPIKNGFV